MSLRGDLHLYGRMLQEARPHLAKIGGFFALDLLASSLGLLTPLPLKTAVDSAIGGHPRLGFLKRALPEALTDSRAAALAVAIGLLILLVILAQLQNLANPLLRSYTSKKLVLGFRARILGHAQRLALIYHDVNGTADTTYRIQYDAAALQYVPVDGFIPFVTAGFTLRGGDFDRWDLEIIGGLLGGIRTRLGVEEHGAAEQLLRLRTWPVSSAAGLAIAGMFVALAAGAMADRARFAGLLLAGFAFLPAAWLLASCARAQAAFCQALRKIGAQGL